MYDQNHEFIDRWQGRDSRAQQDVVDMVDWPIATQQENGDK